MASFVHLRVKSAYSLLEGAVRPKELAELARDSGMPAVAVTDVNNLFGVFEISDTLAKAGVQPIVGALLSVELDGPQRPTIAARAASRRTSPLLVQNEAGYRNLTKLLSAAYLEAEPGDWPHVKAAKLAAHAEGLIALTGGPGGPINQLLLEGQREAADSAAGPAGGACSPTGFMSNCSATAWPKSAPPKMRCIDLAYAKDLPLVATNDVHFGNADMYEAHDALLCIADGTFVSQEDRRRLTREHRFKTAAEMAAQFADLPEAIENTIEIARRCAFRPKKRNPILPQFVPEFGPVAGGGIEGAGRSGPRRGALRSTAAGAEREGLSRAAGLRARHHHPHGFPGLLPDRVRLHEVDARRRAFRSACAAPAPPRWSPGRSTSPISIPCASACSSSASSIPNASRCRTSTSISARSGATRSCAMCATNTAHDRVAHIMALGSLQARAAVRDAGRVLQMPLGLVDRIAKLIPNPPGKRISLHEAIESEPRLQQIAEQEPHRRAPVRDRREDRRALPPRLDPSGRRGDRRPAAGRDPAALSRSALRHAGDAIRL